MTGVAALALQNLVDFNLEIPGVALPVAAILGASGVTAVKGRRLSITKPLGVTFAVLPVLLLGVALAGTMVTPDLVGDLQYAQAKAWSADPDALAELDPVAKRHPANPVVSARIAYAAETHDPPDLKAALRWANRTMYLAPTYADGHVVTGRLLLQFGYRDQAFAEMRQAWSMTDELDGERIISQVVQLARTVDEIRRAVPRRDSVMDEPDEKQLALVALFLIRQDRTEWAEQLLDSVGPIESVPPSSLGPLATAALRVGNYALAERALTRSSRVAPGEAATLEGLLEVLVHKNDLDAARALIAEALGVRDIDPSPFLRARLELALQSNHLEEARETLGEMQRRLSPTQQNQVLLARMQSRIELRDNHPMAAVHAMDDAIRLAPGRAELRVERARLLLRVGKRERARIDAKAALDLAPNNGSAKAILDRLPEKVP